MGDNKHMQQETRQSGEPLHCPQCGAVGVLVYRADATNVIPRRACYRHMGGVVTWEVKP